MCTFFLKEKVHIVQSPECTYCENALIAEIYCLKAEKLRRLSQLFLNA
jgi:hypothetical protein